MVEQHSVRFSNLVSGSHEQAPPAEIQEMKRTTRNSQARTPTPTGQLTLAQLRALHETRDIRDRGRRLLRQMGEEHRQAHRDRSKPPHSGLDVHGLALVRLLLHRHPTQAPYELEQTSFQYASSSLGTLDLRLLFDLAYAFVPGFCYELRHLSDELAERLRRMFRVVYPSEQHISESVLGPENANCLFLDPARYRSKKFERSVLCKFETSHSLKGRPKLIPHLKAAIVSNDRGKVNDDTIIYVGSHNMTKAAWGRFTALGERVFVSNYELGVILPPAPGSASKKSDLMRKLGLVYPAQRFGKNEAPFLKKSGNRSA